MNLDAEFCQFKKMELYRGLKFLSSESFYLEVPGKLWNIHNFNGFNS